MKYIITIPLKEARTVQAYLQQHDLFDKNYKYVKTTTDISYVVNKPIKKSLFDVATKKATAKDLAQFPIIPQKRTLKEALADVLSKKELELLKTSYDIIGTIAILEIDDELRKKEKQIAGALLETNSSIKTVLRKDGSHEGIFRNQKMKFLAGIDTRETEHVESGVKIITNVETVYFSPRSSTERARIAKLVKPGENILCFFSGAGPYPLIFAKHTAAKHIVGVEINPDGHKYAQLNVKKNHFKNIVNYCGDVHKILPTFWQKNSKKSEPRYFDRITMPLPKTASEFLDDAFAVSKPGTVIHYYDFLHEDKFQEAVEKVQSAAKKQGATVSIQGIHTCGCQGVRTYRICVDVKVESIK